MSLCEHKGFFSFFSEYKQKLLHTIFQLRQRWKRKWFFFNCSGFKSTADGSICFSFGTGETVGCKALITPELPTRSHFSQFSPSLITHWHQQRQEWNNLSFLPSAAGSRKATTGNRQRRAGYGRPEDRVKMISTQSKPRTKSLWPQLQTSSGRPPCGSHTSAAAQTLLHASCSQCRKHDSAQVCNICHQPITVPTWSSFSNR